MKLPRALCVASSIASFALIAVDADAHEQAPVGPVPATPPPKPTEIVVAGDTRVRAGDILSVVPGLFVVQHAGGGKANQYFLRGFDADHGTDVALFVDGVPINLPSYGHGQGWLAYAYRRDNDDTKRERGGPRHPLHAGLAVHRARASYGVLVTVTEPVT